MHLGQPSGRRAGARGVAVGVSRAGREEVVPNVVHVFRPETPHQARRHLRRRFPNPPARPAEMPARPGLQTKVLRQADSAQWPLPWVRAVAGLGLGVVAFHALCGRGQSAGRVVRVERFQVAQALRCLDQVVAREPSLFQIALNGPKCKGNYAPTSNWGRWQLPPVLAGLFQTTLERRNTGFLTLASHAVVVCCRRESPNIP